LFRRRKKNHTSAIKIIAPATPPTTPPTITPVSVVEAGFAALELVGVGDTVGDTVGDAVDVVDDVELGVAVSR
jgi:hypothetical protein